MTYVSDAYSQAPRTDPRTGRGCVLAADDSGWLQTTNQVNAPRDAVHELMFVAVGEQSHLVAAATFKVVLPFRLRPGTSSAPQVNGGG